MANEGAALTKDIEHWKQAVAEETERCRKYHHPFSPILLSSLTNLAAAYEQNKSPEDAERTYRDAAERAAKAETDAVQHIMVPAAFSRLAQFLERHGKARGAEQWYEKLVSMRVNAHAFGIQADALQRYAAILRSQHDDTKANKLEAQAKKLQEEVDRLNKAGLDY